VISAGIVAVPTLVPVPAARGGVTPGGSGPLNEDNKLTSLLPGKVTVAGVAACGANTGVALVVSVPGAAAGAAFEAAPAAVIPCPSPAPPYAPSPDIKPFSKSPVTRAVPPPTIILAVKGLITPPEPIVKAAPASIGSMLSRKPASGSPVLGFIVNEPPCAIAMA
jgi:hypothetical protein